MSVVEGGGRGANDQAVMDGGTCCMDAGTPGAREGERVSKLMEQVGNLKRRNGVLRRKILRLEAENKSLHSRVARLEQQLREAAGPARATARNSSLPPSANPPGVPGPVRLESFCRKRH